MMQKTDIIEQMSSPSLITFFISATFGFLNFASSCLNLGPSEVFSIGVLRMLLGFLFFICSIIQIFHGEIYGNINLIFSICFGFFSGTSVIARESEEVKYELMQPAVFSFVQIAAGTYLLCLLPVMKKIPLYQWLGYFLVASGLVLLGISYFSSIKILEIISGLGNFVFGFLNLYGGLRVVEDTLPKGKTSGEFLFESVEENEQRRHMEEE